MTTPLTSGRYTGGYGDLSIYIDIAGVSYTSINTGTFIANCNYHGDFISLNGTFIAPHPGTSHGAVMKMQSTSSTGNRVSSLSIELLAKDPNFHLLEGSHTIHFANNTWGSNSLGVRRM